MVTRDVLHDIRLNLVAIGQETSVLSDILTQERQAIRTFDADQLQALAEKRDHVLGRLNQIEKAMHAVVCQGNSYTSLSEFLNGQADSDARDLEAFRAETQARLEGVREEALENRLRLMAAHDVVTSVLQHIGIANDQGAEAYGPGRYR